MKFTRSVSLVIATALIASLPAVAIGQQGDVKKLNVQRTKTVTVQSSFADIMYDPTVFKSSSVTAANPAALSAEQNLDGGFNSGGGNAVNFQMIESYAVGINDIPVYRDLLIPLFKKMDQYFPTTEKLFRTRAERLTWYLIPAEIAELPESKTGLRFGSQQIAYQIREEVFINSAMLEKMGGKSKQALLFLHEIVMGLNIEFVRQRRWQSTGPMRDTWIVQPRDVRILTTKIANEAFKKDPIAFRLALRTATEALAATPAEFAMVKPIAKEVLSTMNTLCEQKKGYDLNFDEKANYLAEEFGRIDKNARDSAGIAMRRSVDPASGEDVPTMGYIGFELYDFYLGYGVTHFRQEHNNKFIYYAYKDVGYMCKQISLALERLK